METPAQVVILGASGDLTYRKLMPALASLAARGQPADGFSVLGIARRPKSDEQFRAEVREALDPSLHAGFDQLAPRVHYHAGDVGDADQLRAMRERVDALPGGREAGRLFYLSLAPQLFAPTVERLASVQLLQRRAGTDGPFCRLVVEKPFGQDLASARSLNDTLHAVLREHQIYRIDHYLGKETVQNLLGFRFHNAIFEPVWNRHHVELVQITVAESIGVEDGRAGYYDRSGALRDMLQNHMLQVLALVAMEPPSTLSPEAIRDQKAAVLRGLHRLDATSITQNTVRARYGNGVVAGRPAIAYREEDGVPEESSTETFVAVRAEIDTWRWNGVPFLLRHGKRMAHKFTEVVVQFRTPPVQLFNRPDGMDEHEFRRRVKDGSLCQIRPNHLTLKIQPHESIHLDFGVKRPGSSMTMTPAKLSFDYRDQFGESTTPAYERLLQDALLGDPTLFLRSDEIEASWEFADSILGHWKEGAVPLDEYAAGTFGPERADELFYGCEGTWSRG